MLIFNQWWSGLEDIEIDAIHAEALTPKRESRHG